MLFSIIAYGSEPDFEKISDPAETAMFKISFDSTCNDEENSKTDSFLLFGTMHNFPRYAHSDTVQKHLKQATGNTRATFGAAHLLGRDSDAHKNVWGILDFFIDLQNRKRTNYWKHLVSHEKI